MSFRTLQKRRAIVLHEDWRKNYMLFQNPPKEEGYSSVKIPLFPTDNQVSEPSKRGGL